MHEMESLASANALANPSAKKVVVVMPAYNAAKTLFETYTSIPEGHVHEIVLVDDASRDETVQLAHQLPMTVIRHPHNVGYGGNQKTCYMEALRKGAEVVVMLHPDNQYDPCFIPQIIAPLLENRSDIVLGSRIKMPGGALKGGMPIWKFIANRILTWMENRVLGAEISDAHTGYRAYSRRFLETVPFLRNSNDFVFDSQILVQALSFGMRMSEIPVTTKYFPGASSVGFRTSVIYGFKTLWTLVRYLLHRTRILKARFLLP